MLAFSHTTYIYIEKKETVFSLYGYCQASKKSRRVSFLGLSFNFITDKQLLIIIQCVCYFCINGLLNFVKLDEEKKKPCLHCCSLDKNNVLKQIMRVFFGKRNKTILVECLI